MLLQVKQAVIWALEAGYRHIDCAAIYGNEVEIGEALQDTFGPGKVKQLNIPHEAQSSSENVSLGSERYFVCVVKSLYHFLLNSI